MRIFGCTIVHFSCKNSASQYCLLKRTNIISKILYVGSFLLYSGHNVKSFWNLSGHVQHITLHLLFRDDNWAGQILHTGIKFQSPSLPHQPLRGKIPDSSPPYQVRIYTHPCPTPAWVLIPASYPCHTHFIPTPSPACRDGNSIRIRP